MKSRRPRDTLFAMATGWLPSAEMLRGSVVHRHWQIGGQLIEVVCSHVCDKPTIESRTI